MKMCIVFFLTMFCLLGLSGCTADNKDIVPTGYSSGEVQRPQIMYNGIIYFYTANGFDNPLPEGFELVGEVNKVDNKQEPSADWNGSRVDVGQKIYASDDASAIYLEYEMGYAEFVSISE